jgi:hypothetical protein
MIVIIAVAVAIVAPAPIAPIVTRIEVDARAGFGHGPLQYLVEFTAIEPHAAALRTIVNLDSLPIGHNEIDFAGGTLHVRCSFR